MTNADKIRAMSDEELAGLLYSFQNLEDKVKYCKNKKSCIDALNNDKDIPDNMCKKCVWLTGYSQKVRRFHGRKTNVFQRISRK